MQAFIPPNFNLFLNWTIDLLFPVLLKSVQNINEVIITEQDKEMLRSLKKERLIFFSNHPTTAEPPLAFHIANIMGSRFKYMASRQVFDWSFGIVGKVISNIGAFSVIAGIADRESLKAARQALSEKEGKLVLFPEGEPTSGENDNLMPFQSGLAQLAFWGYEDILKVDQNGELLILPSFMKYVVDASEKEIFFDLDDSASKIESKYNINPGRKNLLRRFLTIGRCMIEEAEQEYSIKDGDKHDFDYRIGRIRHTILDNLADKFSIKTFDRNQDAIIKLRQLFAVMELVSIGYPDDKLPKMSESEIEFFKKECIKAFDFIVIKGDYLASNPTPERFYEWLARYESYIFSKTPRALGGEPTHLPRKAYITFKKPFKISEYYNEYKSSKKEAVNKMMERLRRDMQELLDSSMYLSRPIVKPFDTESQI
jgi:hypothetical protein